MAASGRLAVAAVALLLQASRCAAQVSPALLATTVPGGPPPAEGTQTEHYLPGSAGGAADDGIGFLLYLPVGFDRAGPWPVLYFLHGSGESEGRSTVGGLEGGGQYDLGLNTLQSVAAHGIAHRIAHEGARPAFVVVSPQAPAHANGGWGGSALPALERLAELVATGLTGRGDGGRNYLTGLSRGGAGTWDWTA
eukprot:SAG22_NODE_2762_length_2234_cov_1.135363_3_plen_193_part_01